MKNRKGEVFKVREIYAGYDQEWGLMIGDFRCGIRLKDVEFVD